RLAFFARERRPREDLREVRPRALALALAPRGEIAALRRIGLARIELRLRAVQVLAVTVDPAGERAPAVVQVARVRLEVDAALSRRIRGEEIDAVEPRRDGNAEPRKERREEV